MSQITSKKPQIPSPFKMSAKSNLPTHPIQDPKLKTIVSKASQNKTTAKQILNKVKPSREPPQIKDPFAGLKKLKVETKKENIKKGQDTEEEDYEKEKQRQEELLALLIGDIMSG